LLETWKGTPAVNLPTVIDVAIGLVLIFFLLATLGSVLAELLTAHQKWRHQLLRQTVNRLLERDMAKRFWRHPLLLPLYDRAPRRLPETAETAAPEAGALPAAAAATPAAAPPTPVPERKAPVKAGFWHRAWRRLSRIFSLLKIQTAEAPAYLDSAVFASVVLDLATGQGAAGRLPSTPSAWEFAIRTHVSAQPGQNNDLQVRLLALLRQVPCDAADCGAAFKAAIAKWYDEAMVRTSSIYRRKLQKALLFIGVVLAVGSNCDAVRIAYVLYQSPNLRTQVAQQADALVKEKTPAADSKPAPAADSKTAPAADSKTAPADSKPAPAADDADLKTLLKEGVGQLRDLTKIGFPIGWAPVWRDNFISKPDGDASAPGFVSYLAKITGLLASALAVCLGAPFWFDLLGRLVKLRSSAGSDAEKKQADGSSGSANAAAAPTGLGGPPAGGSSVAVAASVPVPLPSATDALAQPGTDFSVARAYWLAEFADHAYETDPGALTQWLGQNGFKLVESLDVDDTQGFLAQAEGVAVLAFRGTEQKLKDWVTDAKFEFVDGAASGVPGRVHVGFAEALAPVAARLDQLVAQLKDRRVLFHVTGHSLGGALATLAALRFGRAPQTACPIHTVHTFGSPRVGDAAFVQAFDALFQDRSYRFVNDEDLVTRVPPRALEYDHVSDIIYIDESGRLQRDIGYWYRFLNFATNALGDLQQAVQTTVKDHSMKLYCGHLEKAARTPTVI
jgi:triacylglycerol lipase